jgi:hypothetical protein
MNPTLNNGKIDIFWRDILEDDSIFLKENKERAILILTNIMTSPSCPRTSVAKYVDILNNRDYSCEEYIRYYAFLT